ncbi:hypothetical protein PTI98_004538 [Pleurotus ostreatus]|nr:hypothetical protein PTI98_004538 [Pleurotus ostreatus]
METSWITLSHRTCVHNSLDNRRNVSSEVHEPLVALCPPKNSVKPNRRDRQTNLQFWISKAAQLISKTGRVGLNPECERNLVLLNLRNNTAHLPTKYRTPGCQFISPYHLVQFIRQLEFLK